MSKSTAYTDETRGGGLWVKVVCSACITAVILLGAVAVFAGLAGRAFAEARVEADFNGDGFDDLAIGVPYEDIQYKGIVIKDAGAVNVIYGSSNRLTSAGNQFWSQNSTGILDATEFGDYFGSSLTAGDFNGDGFDDLAIGVYHENIGSIFDAGAVNVIYGITGSGLNSTGNQFWSQDSPGILDIAEESDSFGPGLNK